MDDKVFTFLVEPLRAPHIEEQILLAQTMGIEDDREKIDRFTIEVRLSYKATPREPSPWEIERGGRGWQNYETTVTDNVSDTTSVFVDDDYVAPIMTGSYIERHLDMAQLRILSLVITEPLP